MPLIFLCCLFISDTTPPEIYTTDTLFPYTTLFRSLGDAGIELGQAVEDAVAQSTQHPTLDDADAGFDLRLVARPPRPRRQHCRPVMPGHRSEEHTSELQSLMRISLVVFCLKKKLNKKNT